MGPGIDIAKIAVFAFVLVFCAIGVGLIYGAWGTFQDGETTNALLMVVAGLAFGGAGIGLLLLTTAGWRLQAREAALRTAHPDAPWLWREDWASGRVRHAEKNVAVFFWGFAILWNLISTPLAVFLPAEIIEKENYGALLGLLFPLVGIGLLVAAARMTIQKRKYGDCLFLMNRVPGILGGDVSGILQVPRGLPAAESITVQLSCIHRERRRSGKDTTTNDEVLWQTEQIVARLSPTGEGEGAAVSFKVPFDASPTGEMDENNSILWKLTANTAVPGVDFSASFEIPVFKTPFSSPRITEESLRSEEVSAQPAIRTPADLAEVAVAPSAGGGKEFLLKPRRGQKGTLPAIVMVLVFAGIAVLIAYAGAPLIFPLVFGGVAVLLTFVVIFGAFGESRIVVEEGHVSVRNSLFGIMSGRRMPCSSIAKVRVKGEAAAGKAGAYSIVFTQENGKTTSPFQSLSDRRQADWLADEVCRAMEPWRREKHAEEAVPG